MKNSKKTNSTGRKYKKRDSNESSNSDLGVEGLTPSNSLPGTSSTGVSRSNSPNSESSIPSNSKILAQVTNHNIPQITCGMLIDKILREKRSILLQSPDVCEILHAASLPPQRIDNENDEKLNY